MEFMLIALKDQYKFSPGKSLLNTRDDLRRSAHLPLSLEEMMMIFWRHKDVYRNVKKIFSFQWKYRFSFFEEFQVAYISLSLERIRVLCQIV